MTEQQQRNADIGAGIVHALDQKDIDCREWERQAKQWQSVADTQRARADKLEKELTYERTDAASLERQCAELVQGLAAAERQLSDLNRYADTRGEHADAFAAAHSALLDRACRAEAERDAERRRNVELEVQLNQTYAHWRDARGAEILLVRNDLEETRRVNRRLLEDYANLSAQLSQAHAECSQAYAERDIFLATQRAVCDVLSYDSGTIAGQTLVEAVRAVIAQRDEARAEAALLRQALMNIRKDAHFANRTVDSAGKWGTLCEEIMQQVDQVTPNGTPGAEMLRDYRHACEIVRDLESKMAPANEYIVSLEARLAALRAAAQPIIRHAGWAAAYVLIDRRAVEGLREAVDGE